ncbi:hypothetical protein [Lactobacillus mulieris]|uniref:hypothetical protein n=1 Tax=Lactobacillus mulieris TaxID=2508708 RepID=UPI002244A4D2|nr:hypothetical protein [Lactobacillus mulieris]MCW8123393.1 hypothetical protein [Lactobacillus mulieris]MDK7326556.1 hypothetical protein [Lactobacillus mulieris]WEB30201.1 hypothetical protein PUW59_05465 [Lactobacillus mulieris]
MTKTSIILNFICSALWFSSAEITFLTEREYRKTLGILYLVMALLYGGLAIYGILAF